MRALATIRSVDGVGEDIDANLVATIGAPGPCPPASGTGSQAPPQADDLGLHLTATAKATAIQERTYANRAGSWGPSATVYIDRDGTIVRAVEPAKYAAWSQGDVAYPNTKIPTVTAGVASWVNMNEWVHESIEPSGSGTEPYTDAQFESVASLVAAASRALGPRSTAAPWSPTPTSTA